MSETPLPGADRIKTLAELVPIVAALRAEGRRVVTTNGCFDIIHPGHVRSFEWAQAQGDVLVVGINSDDSIRALKGEKRPIVDAQNRARVLAGLRAVDYVFIFDGNPPSWFPLLKPDIHIKGEGSAQDPAFPAEKALVESFGGELRLAPYSEGLSTTNIIETIVQRYGA